MIEAKLYRDRNLQIIFAVTLREVFFEAALLALAVPPIAMALSRGIQHGGWNVVRLFWQFQMGKALTNRGSRVIRECTEVLTKSRCLCRVQCFNKFHRAGAVMFSANVLLCVENHSCIMPAEDRLESEICQPDTQKLAVFTFGEV